MTTRDPRMMLTAAVRAAADTLSLSAFTHTDGAHSVDANGTEVQVRDLPNGRYELTLIFGPVSMQAEISRGDVAFLFDLPVTQGAAGIAPLMAVPGKDAA